MSRLFGTDGIRGKYGIDITGDTAYRLGNALGRENVKVVVGRDTRLSGGELYKYLKKGILDAGADIVNLGIVTTPIVAYVTEHIKADYGVAITASHNSKEYNGLKVFSSTGGKIDSEIRDEIEECMRCRLYISKSRGKEQDGTPYIECYKNMLFNEFLGISGLNIGIDTANGASSYIASEIFGRIFGDANIINNEGDGNKINEDSGALHPEAIRKVVLDNKLDVGFAFDGDADRIIAVSSSGRIINGDLMLYAISRYLKSKGKLTNNLAIGTIYTNVGVEKSLANAGIDLYRSEVGDSFVAEYMATLHASIGAERAGHVILSDYMATGDGVLVALYLSNIMFETGKSLDELTSCNEYGVANMDIVTDKARMIVEDEEVLKKRDEIMAILDKKGRVLLRASGTENKLRIMVECEDESMLDNSLDEMVSYIKDRYKM